VASTFSVFVVTEVVPPSLDAVHVSVVPVFGSLTRTAGSHPTVEVIGESGSLTDQWTTMNAPLEPPRYQPLVPTVPDALPTTDGAVLSTVTVRVGEVKALPALSVVMTRRS